MLAVSNVNVIQCCATVDGIAHLHQILTLLLLSRS